MECSLVSWRFPCSWRFSFLTRHHLATSSHGIGNYCSDFYGIVDLTFGWGVVGDVMSRIQPYTCTSTSFWGLINFRLQGGGVCYRTLVMVLPHHSCTKCLFCRIVLKDVYLGPSPSCTCSWTVLTLRVIHSDYIFVICKVKLG